MFNGGSRGGLTFLTGKNIVSRILEALPHASPSFAATGAILDS